MATLAEKIRWVLTDRERRRSTLEWYGAKALFRRPRLKLPFGATLSYFKTYGQYWGCRSQIPDRGCCALLERRIGIGSTVIDVGAYMGVFTVMIGKFAGKAVVYSFEPTSITYEQLVLNIRENHLKNVKTINAAVCCRQGRMRFSITDSPMGNKLEMNDFAEGPNFIEVDTTTIDTFCKSQRIERLDFAKIDVEGAEPQVPLGARQMMGERCIECILIEVCPDNLASLKSSPEELFSIADSYGYDFFTLTNDGTPGRRLTARDLRQITIDNVLLMPR